MKVLCAKPALTLPCRSWFLICTEVTRHVFTPKERAEGISTPITAGRERFRTKFFSHQIPYVTAKTLPNARISSQGSEVALSFSVSSFSVAEISNRGFIFCLSLCVWYLALPRPSMRPCILPVTSSLVSPSFLDQWEKCCFSWSIWFGSWEVCERAKAIAPRCIFLFLLVH